MSSCCAPTKARALILDSSTRDAAERIRVTSGSTEDMLRLDGVQFLMGSEDAESIQAEWEGALRRVAVECFKMNRYQLINEKFY